MSNRYVKDYNLKSNKLHITFNLKLKQLFWVSDLTLRYISATALFMRLSIYKEKNGQLSHCGNTSKHKIFVFRFIPKT